MRIGVMISNTLGPCSFSEAVDAMGAVAAAGLDTVWVPQNYGIESLTLIAAAGPRLPDIELGTAIVPTYSRHPMTMASQALTAQAACGGRLTLGIGPSHQLATEGIHGHPIPPSRPPHPRVSDRIAGAPRDRWSRVLRRGDHSQHPDRSPTR